MDLFDIKEKNIRRIEAYYQREALSNKRADLFSKIFLVILFGGLTLFFFTTSILNLLEHSDKSMVFLRCAQMHVILLGLTLPFIKGAKKLLIIFFVFFGILIPNGYYIYVSGFGLANIRYYFSPIIINIVTIAVGMFLWKMNKHLTRIKKR